MSSSDERSDRHVPFFRPAFDEREYRAVEEVMRSGWITTGERAQEFERRFAEYVGAEHAVAVNSCTAALHLALAAEGIGPGDEVITSPYTFVATVEAICYLGAKPVLVDIDRATRNVDPSRIEEKITERTRAVVPIHIAGLPCEMEPILAIAKRHGLAVIEDAAHALPASYRGRRIGSVGRATAFSFYATKNLTTAEGGMITTDDPALAARYRRMALHGIDADGWKRYRKGGRWFYSVTEMGYKYNLTDIAAAIGLVQLQKLDGFDHRRQEISQQYSREFAAFPQFELPFRPQKDHHAWHLYILGIAKGSPVSRDELIRRLTERNIATSVHFIPVHLHPYYARLLDHRTGDFPQAEAAFEGAVSLPIYPGMTAVDVERVISAVCESAEA